MKLWRIGLLMVLLASLAGCGGGEATPVAEEAIGDTYTSALLDTSYTDALSVNNQLLLGTLQLEETEHAVTPEQAADLLPLWQALQGGVTARAEVNAVLKQIEGTMTSEQLEAIAVLQLTQADVRAWMQEQGLGMEAGFPGPGGDVSEEDRAAAQATRQAGGGFPGEGEMPAEIATRRAEMENMSDEEREAFRATAQAGGGLPGGAAGTRGRQANILLRPLIELLETRAAGG
jgi:hypothetical protein